MDKFSLAQLWGMLNVHDWYHSYSDELFVRNLGSTNESKLRALAAETEGGVEMMEAFKLYHFSGKSFGTKRSEKPIKPLTDSVNSEMMKGEA